MWYKTLNQTSLATGKFCLHQWKLYFKYILHISTVFLVEFHPFLHSFIIKSREPAGARLNVPQKWSKDKHKTMSNLKYRFDKHITYIRSVIITSKKIMFYLLVLLRLCFLFNGPEQLKNHKVCSSGLYQSILLWRCALCIHSAQIVVKTEIADFVVLEPGTLPLSYFYHCIIFIVVDLQKKDNQSRVCQSINSQFH